MPRPPCLAAAASTSSGNAAEAALCGPTDEDPPVRFGLRQGNAERLCRSILDHGEQRLASLRIVSGVQGEPWQPIVSLRSGAPRSAPDELGT